MLVAIIASFLWNTWEERDFIFFLSLFFLGAAAGVTIAALVKFSF